LILYSKDAYPNFIKNEIYLKIQSQQEDFSSSAGFDMK